MCTIKLQMYYPRWLCAQNDRLQDDNHTKYMYKIGVLFTHTNKVLNDVQSILKESDCKMCASKMKCNFYFKQVSYSSLFKDANMYGYCN